MNEQRLQELEALAQKPFSHAAPILDLRDALLEACKEIRDLQDRLESISPQGYALDGGVSDVPRCNWCGGLLDGSSHCV